MKIVWTTDIHLEFADELARSIFYRTIANEKADCLVVTGDIANSKLIERLLREMQAKIGIPVYFNLGNHDFYGGSVLAVRKWARAITKAKVPLHWIEAAGIVDLGDRACLVGVDGWGDGQLGDPMWSKVLLNDWDLIDEFSIKNAIHDKAARMDLLGKLGQSAAHEIRATLIKALPKFDQVLLMTHVPPWKEATWHEGAHSNDDWLPWFSCKAVGDAIVEQAAKHPSKKITVLCGHTHGAGHSKINDQIEVYTGGARYRSPEVQQLFDVVGGQITRIAPTNWFSTGY
jgi:Icc-related predicted phosphoesterase